jgi:hemolysin III
MSSVDLSDPSVGSIAETPRSTPTVPVSPHAATLRCSRPWTSADAELPISGRLVRVGPPAGRAAVDRASEAWANALAHGIGTVFSVVGAGVLLGRLRASFDWVLILACAVYSTTLLAVYVCSTLSRHLEKSRLKRAFRILDQAFIYLLIVGTYTPIAALHLRGGGWCVLFWAMWYFALGGFLSKTVLDHRVDTVSTAVYVVLGWLPMLAAHSAWLLVPKSALLLLVLGGICYLVGLAFFLRDQRARYYHAAWHLLVIVGSAFHFYAVIVCLKAASEAARIG